MSDDTSAPPDTTPAARHRKFVSSVDTDTNLQDHPAYPMRRDTGHEHDGMSWERPTQQVAHVEILHSNERPNLSAVFGTSVPPQGLSGSLRRWAFQFSESHMLHWIPLMVADRVQMVEADLADIGLGRLPNLPKEWGWPARWKHDRSGLALTVGGTALALGALWLLTRRDS